MQNAYKTESVALLALKSLRSLRRILKQSKKQKPSIFLWTACLIMKLPYFFSLSISEIERWIKSERFLPFSMPLDSSARSIIWRTRPLAPPISFRRSLRSSRSVTTFFDKSSRIVFSSALKSASFLSFTTSSKRFSSATAASIFLVMLFNLSPYSFSTSDRMSITIG